MALKPLRQRASLFLSGIKEQVLSRPNRIWSISDQFISSSSNLVLTVLIAKSVSSDDFGRFALIWALYWLCLGGFRAFISEPMLIVSQDDIRNVIDTSRATTGVTVMVAILLSAVVVCVSVAIGSVAYGFLTFGLVLPGIMWQDSLRYSYIMKGEARRAFAIDSIWLVLITIAGAQLWSMHAKHIYEWVAAWGIAGTMSAAFGILLWGPKPSMTSGTAWIRKHHTVSVQMLSEFMISSGISQLIVFFIPLVSSLIVLGALKAAQVATSPINLLFSSLMVVVLPTIARAHNEGRNQQVVQIGRTFAWGAAIAALGWTLGLEFLPSHVGHIFLGSNWTDGRTIAPIIALQTGVSGVGVGALVILRATRRIALSVIARIFSIPISIGLPLLGASLWGEKGLAFGILTSSAILSTIYWILAVRGGSSPSKKSQIDK